MADIIQELIKNVAKTTYSDLTSEAIDYAKKSFLDTLGVAIAGSSGEGCREVVDLVRGWGGKKEATIWVFGGKVPVNLAGFANGPIARARDLGDVHHLYAGGHISEYIIPALLPMAEYKGGVTGKEFITALALGQDVMARIGASTRRSGVILVYHPHRILGPTAAVAKLMGLDEEGILNALGIAFSQVGGENQSNIDGGLTVRLEHGFIADGAIKAVLLGQRGVTGARNILEGERGYFKAYDPVVHPELLTKELGKAFFGAYGTIKPYASCAYTHTSIFAALDMMQKHNLKPEDIEEMDFGLAEGPHKLVCHPWEVKSNPKTTIDCQFSLPYTVACAAIRGKVFIEDFTEEAINDSRVRSFMPKVKAHVDNSVITPGEVVIGGATVSIKTRDGKTYSGKVDHVKGQPRNPMSIQEVVDKFRNCVPFSARRFSDKNADRVIDMVTNLENVKNVAEIAELMAP